VLPPPASSADWGTWGVREEVDDWGRTGGGKEAGNGGGAVAADWGNERRQRIGELGFHQAFIPSQRKQRVL
jgi:hypothetical protein